MSRRNLAHDLGEAFRICIDGVNTIAVTARDLEDRKRALQGIYQGTHDGALPPRDLQTMMAPTPFNGDLVEMGALVGVIYRTRKGKRYGDWEHLFGREPGWDPNLKIKPVLAHTADGRGLVILGGNYYVKNRGIIG